MKLRTLVLRLLRVPCGEYGGTWGSGPDERTRWCHKLFGHGDSCAYELGAQPLVWERRRAKGWPLP